MKLSKFHQLIIALISSALFIAPAFAEQRADTAENITKLEGRKWKVTSVGDIKEKHLGFIRFENGQLEGQSTCNNYSGVYDLHENNTITIHRLGLTILICKIGNKMQIEEQYVEGLEAATSYKIEKDELIILTGEKEVARFK